MTTNANAGPLTTVESFLSQVGALKQAEAHTEPGSIGGPTTHPVKGVDDNTETAREGARSAENAKDVKNDQGPPSVDSTAEATAKSAAGGPGAEDHLQLGTTVAATGEDPANETGKAKGGKDDPGSSHPARTDNDALDGFKYAKDLNTAPLEKIAAAIQDVGNALCADMALQGAVIPQKQAGDDTAAAAVVAGRPTPKEQANGVMGAKQAVDANLAAQVGGELAGILTGTLDKQAADVMVTRQLGEILKEAEEDGHRVGRWLQQYQAAQLQHKRAGDDATPPHPSSGGGGDSVGSMLGGGGGQEPPMPGGGGDSGGGAAAGGGAAGGGGDSLAQLDALLKQMGITPEELQQALLDEGGGMGGGAAGGGAMGGGGAGGAGAAAMDPAAAAGGGAGGGMAGPMAGVGGGMQVTAAAKADDVTKQAVAMISEIVQRSRIKRAAAAAAAAAAK